MNGALLPLYLVIAGVAAAWAGPAAAHTLHAAILLAFAARVVYGEFTGRQLRLHWLAAIPAGIAVLSVVQVMFHATAVPYATWDACGAWSARFAILALAAEAPRRRGGHHAAITGLAIFSAGLALLTLLAWHSSPGRVLWLIPTAYDAGIAGTFLNPDQYAAFIELTLPIALFRSLGSRRPLYWTLAAAVMIASVLTTGSRMGSALVSAEALAFLVFQLTGRTRRVRRPALLLGMGFVCALLLADTSGLRVRLTLHDPLAYRREMLQSTVEMIRERPSSGFGMETWPLVYPAFASFDPPGVFMNHAHNDWAEWTAEGGVFGLLLLLAIAAAEWRWMLRAPWSAGVGAIFVHALVDFPMHKEALAIACFALLGWTAREIQDLTPRRQQFTAEKNKKNVLLPALGE